MGFPNRSRVTIKDVAKACGVSTQTISRVINDRIDVSSTTREKILAVMQEMDYQPSALARSMRQNSKTLGVIVAELRFVGISSTLNGITQAADARGYSLMLKELPSFDSMEMQPLIQSLIAHRVEGIIYAAPEVGENWKTIQRNLSKQIPPMVYLKGNPSSAPITLSMDNYSGAYSITRHLIDQGYRHIAHISGPMDWWESRERQRAWSRALFDAGLPVPEYASIQGNWSSASGYTCMDSLLKQYPEMDAVFAANDQMALGVLNIAWEKHINIPGQLGVAGFDDIPESKYFSPPLTTVYQDLNKLGDLAVRKLISLSSPDDTDPAVQGNSLMLPTELRVRQSTTRQN
ncbi:LacI family DNA-binding transcriptional regulator [Leptolinea tardivitalis]|uniref:LacI family DNA-binding transcriptional regulator n=1 Tax=Leptolinea tardivitalis TaxID=229920 RepID=UPI0007805B20|nr:LacI family DNA-binding transcriptional regulator [Leptolinea tardivitalis]GAP21836.1 transcriptional regulator, LacI family [Leptolinea tardivitalis]